jgi:hypothetical protein
MARLCESHCMTVDSFCNPTELNVSLLPVAELTGDVFWMVGIHFRCAQPAISSARSTNAFQANTQWYPKNRWLGSVARYSWLVGKSGEILISAQRRLAMA